MKRLFLAIATVMAMASTDASAQYFNYYLDDPAPPDGEDTAEFLARQSRIRHRQEVDDELARQQMEINSIREGWGR